MFRRFSVNFALFSMALDATLICVALAAATYLRPYLGFIPFAAHYPSIIPTPWIIYPIFASEWLAIMLLFSVYDGRKNIHAVDEFTSLTLATIFAALAMAGTLFLSFRMVSRLLFIAYVLLAYLGMLGWRAIASFALRSVHASPKGKRKVLIIGAGQVGRELQGRIDQNPQFRLQIIGFLDDDLQKQQEYPDVLGPVELSQDLVIEEQVDDVIIALPQGANPLIDPLVGELHALPVKVWVIPDYFRLALHKASVEEFAGIPLLDLRAPALNDYQRLVKRAFDLMVVLFTLPFVLIVSGLIALGITLEGRGGVIFRQERVGENGRIFTMYKFRTMVPGSEAKIDGNAYAGEMGQIFHKSVGDPRVTRLGRFLRRSSLDELPQVFNVLKGEMSLVGPRPEMPHLVERYEPWQRQRFAIPQGITGWWQISGRSEKPMHLNTEDDIYYLQNYSILLDLYILFKTIPAVISGKGAF